MIQVSHFIQSKFLGGILPIYFLLVPFVIFSQSKEQRKEIRAAQNYLSEAQQSLQKEKFAEAEADFRQAISLNPKSEVAKYNLGTAYYEKEKNEEAMLRFHQAATTATTKSEKHKAFHNLGNTFMNAKKYQEAVAAYKDALRNNPHDDETRYNLALAKDMLEKNPPPEDNEDNEQEQEQEQEQNENDPQNQDNKDQEESGSEREDGDEDEQEGNQENEGNQPNKPLEEEGEKPQQQQQVPGQLSPQQIKSLLEAMNNEEKKVQEKINAEKQKGVKVKSDKDW